MKKLKFIKTLFIGIAISMVSSTVILAYTDEGQQIEGQGQQIGGQGQQPTVTNNLLEKQKQIDKFVFEEHANEISDKGFKVINTGVVGNFIEIGIMPYSEENAEYLYNAFGNDLVKIIEGKQVVTVGTATDSPDNSVSSTVVLEEEIDEGILNKQIEINQYVFNQYKDKISEKGFEVTHTAPFKDYVEIGIIPYNEENAKYLYSILGRDMVKVVEGQQVTIMDGQEVSYEAEIYATTAINEDKEKSSELILPVVILSICVLCGGTIFMKRKKANFRS
jgi:hypothetical protein